MRGSGDPILALVEPGDGGGGGLLFFFLLVGGDQDGGEISCARVWQAYVKGDGDTIIVITIIDWDGFGDLVEIHAGAGGLLLLLLLLLISGEEREGLAERRGGGRGFVIGGGVAVEGRIGGGEMVVVFEEPLSIEI